MLKSLHLKNWRSIRDASIEFSPTHITVLIGANASGKTNVLDALYFLRDMMRKDVLQSLYRRGGGDKIRTLGTNMSESVIVEFSSQFLDDEPITYATDMEFLDNLYSFRTKHTLQIGTESLYDFYDELKHSETAWDKKKILEASAHLEKSVTALNQVRNFINTRWQLLDENFLPPLSAALSSMGDLYTIEPDARNVVFMLDFMKQTNPSLYENLQEDLRFLLGHVSHLAAKTDEYEAHIAFHENNHPEKEAPTVSAGTARLLAVLAAVYALDMRNSEMPGLVVIEEPETSLNPSLLRKFVELLRSYTEDAEKPRQFILTTHNPTFLNYFQPEEVRVVSRDEDGNTVINPVPDYIREIWLDEHGLGDAWLTNAFGGVTE